MVHDYIKCLGLAAAESAKASRMLAATARIPKGEESEQQAAHRRESLSPAPGRRFVQPAQRVQLSRQLLAVIRLRIRLIRILVQLIQLSARIRSFVLIRLKMVVDSQM